MDAIEAIKTRRSIRAFTDSPIPRQTLEDLIDCARLAPCAMNNQQWAFVVVTDAKRRAELARAVGHAPQIATVPACIAVVCQDQPFYVEDGSAAAMNIMLAARAHGLGTCWIAVDKQPYARQIAAILNVPDDHHVVLLLTLGYPAEDPSPQKKPLSAVLRWNAF
jgi:nitroreductase